MNDQGPEVADVDRFILDRIDSVPHLEALLLLWNCRPQPWSAVDLGERLYVSPDVANQILQGLAAQQLITSKTELEDQYYYESKSPETDRLLDLVQTTYRRETIRLSTMIHSKLSPGAREFARAFRLKKDRG